LTLNRYTYAVNNPVNYLDPNGEFPWLIVGGVLLLGALVGGGIAYHNSDGNAWSTVKGAFVGLLAGAGLLLGGWAMAATAELIASLALEFLAALPVGAQMAWFRFADMLYRFETQHPLAAGALYSGLETGLAYPFLDDNPTFGGFVLSFVTGVIFFGAMVGIAMVVSTAYNAYMASGLRQTVISGMNRLVVQVRMGFDTAMERFGRPKPLAYIGGRPVYSIQGGALGPGPVQAYEVDTYAELNARSAPFDDLQLHHAPQKAKAYGLVPGYPEPPSNQAPAIALPKWEHRLVTAAQQRRDVTGMTARQLLADDIRMLRRYTQAPTESLRALIRVNKELYDYTK
jgi:hypothetical protein